MWENWDGFWYLSRRCRVVDVEDLAIIIIHNHLIADPSGDRSVKAQLSFSWTNVARLCFLLETKLVTVKCGITSWSALVQCVSCRKITRPLYAVDNWQITQIFLVLRLSMFRCNIMDPDGPNLPSVDLPYLFRFHFCFRGRGSILLSPQKHTQFIIIRQIMCQFPKSPRD